MINESGYPQKHKKKKEITDIAKIFQEHYGIEFKGTHFSQNPPEPPPEISDLIKKLESYQNTPE